MPNTQKDDNYHKISHATHIAHRNNSQLKMEHFSNTSDSSNLSDIFARHKARFNSVIMLNHAYWHSAKTP